MLDLFAQVDLANAVSDTIANGDLDLNQLAHLSGGNPMMLLALGAIGIFGGKKAWDWLKQRQEQQHEQKMAEIEAQKAPTSTGHEQCVAKQQELETQVTGLKGKLTEVENKAVLLEKESNQKIQVQQENLDSLELAVRKTKKKVKKLEEQIVDSERRKGK